MAKRKRPRRGHQSARQLHHQKHKNKGPQWSQKSKKNARATNGLLILWKKRLTRPHIWWILSVAMVIVIAAVTVYIRTRPIPPIPLRQATTVGHTVFPDGDTEQGGTGKPIDGIGCSNMEQTGYHIHVHLSLFINGRQVAIPKGIGATPPRTVDHNFVDTAGCFYWIHTHDETGIIHIEAPSSVHFTLGEFFDVWGRDLTNHSVAGVEGAVKTYVNGTLFNGDPREIALTSHEQIVLAVNSPGVRIPVYIFPKELPH